MSYHHITHLNSGTDNTTNSKLKFCLDIEIVLQIVALLHFILVTICSTYHNQHVLDNKHVLQLTMLFSIILNELRIIKLI